MLNYTISILPLLPACVLVAMIENEQARNIIFTSILIGFLGFLTTTILVPIVSEYTLKKGLCGKDLCKKGSPTESKDIPEALGIVTGTVFLICAIFSQLRFGKTLEQLTVYNSALFSICFMIFLGFTDDSLDLKWRYKLILPTVASLPLLVAYSGSTAVYIPNIFQSLLMNENKLTYLGSILNMIVTVDTEAHGAIVELGFFMLVFMGLLAVFCTNAINILAGINGLECGQSYIIAASILFFKLYDIYGGTCNENQLFAVSMVIPFIGTTLGLLRYNWYPSRVFVGDTFCYFAGMTFSVIGIHGHFSKTLLLLFIPQILNFLLSLPQLFKIVPCPRHRLPKVNPSTQLLHYSTFPCSKEALQFWKVHKDDNECPNFTLLCVVLRLLGPLRESTLCIVVLTIQIICSGIAFFIRYSIFDNI